MIIFLDIDGVLTTAHSIVDRCKIGGYKFDKKCVIAFNNFIALYQFITLVITSDWRKWDNKEKLQKIFYFNKVKQPIHSLTPFLNKDRGLEIKEWFKNNIDFKNKKFIIIDDNVFGIKIYFKSAYILWLQNGWYNGGFKEKHIKIIEKKLQEQKELK